MKGNTFSFLFTVSCLLTIPFLSLVEAQIVYPSPSWDYSPKTPRVGDIIVFDASEFDEQWNDKGISTIISLDWNFGDGANAHGELVNHAYTQSGNYLAELTAIDSLGHSATSGYNIGVREKTALTVYMSFSSDITFTGQTVTISGNLTNNDAGVPNELIELSRKTYIEGDTWQTISTVKTDSSGKYSSSWKTVFGYYEVRARWLGNATYPETSISADLIVKNFGNLITDFVSNSTITGLNFNQTTNILTFNAEGPTGTKGYVNITLQKDQTVNPEKINVLFDGKTIDYNVASNDETWILSFDYPHSRHSIIVQLKADEIPEFPTLIVVPIALSLLPLIAMAKRKEFRSWKKEKRQ
jgi:hypothetical protein